MDTSLADLAADASAPTPSAAAERLVPSAVELAQQLVQLFRRLTRIQRHQLGQQAQRIDHLRLRLRLLAAQHHNLQSHRNQFSSRLRELHAVSPLSVLGRGYAILRNQNGQVIRSADQARTGDALTAYLAEGELSLTVNEAGHLSEPSA